MDIDLKHDMLPLLEGVDCFFMSAAVAAAGDIGRPLQSKSRSMLSHPNPSRVVLNTSSNALLTVGLLQGGSRKIDIEGAGT